MPYTNKVYRTQDTLTIASGGALTVDAGATFPAVRVVRVALAAVDTGGGIFSWANPESGAVAVTRVFIDVTTVATSACTIDVGTTASSATTSSDNLIDGLDVNGATGLFGNLGNPGSNGKTSQRLASGKWVTGSKASGASAGIAGYAYITYIVL